MSDCATTYRHSVVIPLYDKVASVGASIDSVLQQTKPAYELIVVDDASGDGSRELAKQRLHDYQERGGPTRVEFVALDHNRGPGHARNQGFAATSGDIVSFLDADDTYVPDLVERCAGAFRNGADVVVLSLRMVPSGRLRPSLAELGPLLKPIDQGAPGRMHLVEPLDVMTHPGFFLGPASAVCRRDLMKDVAFDERCHLYEGIDYWYRVLRGGLERENLDVQLLDGAPLCVRETERSLSRAPLASHHEVEPVALLERLRLSEDRHDRALVQVIGHRWVVNSFARLPNRWQKLRFIWRFRQLFGRHPQWLLPRST